MSRLLVVGATGQLGTEVVRQARAAGRSVRALVRRSSRHLHLQAAGVDIAYGDLRDLESLRAACEGVDAVVATATVVFPTGQYDFDQDEGRGYENLARACLEGGVAQLLFSSIAMPFSQEYLQRVPSLRMKAASEKVIRESGVPYTIFRFTPFMDDYFALMGSALPLRGEVAATLARSRGMTRVMRQALGSSIERWGIAAVPGPASARHAFIAVRDVAAYLLAAVGAQHALGATLEVGGPEALSWQEVGDIYSELFGRRVATLSTPAQLYGALASASAKVSQAFANQMSLLWVLGQNETTLDSRILARRFGVSPMTALQYLTDKWQAGAPGPGFAGSPAVLASGRS